MSLPTSSDAINALTGPWKDVGALLVLAVTLFLIVHNYAVDDYLRIQVERNHEQLVLLHCVGGKGASTVKKPVHAEPPSAGLRPFRLHGSGQSRTLVERAR